MDLFDFGRKKRALAISRTLETPRTAPTAILEGDEQSATPVEEAANLGKLARLHPFSPVAISLLQRFNQDNISMQAIADLVQTDPALAAETLAYVNSPMFAVRESVTQLRHAIVVLGADNVKRLASTLAFRAMARSAPKPAVTRRLWRHSVATGVIAAELAPVYGLPADLANTAGILHDVGRLGLLAKDGDAYVKVVLDLYDNVDAILAAEREVCGLDHCQAGAYLCRTWRIPGIFEEVAAQHHEAKEDASLSGLVHVACAMADDITFAAVSHRSVLPAAERVAECVPEGLREKVLQRWAKLEERIADKVKEFDF